MTNKATNAGVTAQTGFEFQLHTAIYKLFCNYKDLFKDKEYRIYLEHSDDIVFALLENNMIYYIESYQAKKSSGEWRAGKKLSDILIKMIDSSKDLLNDKLVNSQSCITKLIFITNNDIVFQIKSRKNTKQETYKINEENTHVNYHSVDTKFLSLLHNDLTSKSKSELALIHLEYIDMPKTAIQQKNTLIGIVDNFFNNIYIDSKATIDVLLFKMREKSNIYNQKKISDFSQEDKYIDNNEISNIFSLCESNIKAFDYWRSYAPNIQKTLKIKPHEKAFFEKTFSEAFDYFKSLNSAFHLSILNFVKEKYSNCEGYIDEEIISNLYDAYILQSNIEEVKSLHLKAIIYAAYFQVINLKP